MSNNPKKCPYYIGMGHQIIICKGIIPGCKIQQVHSAPGKEKAHYAEFCCNAYHRCATALLINTAWNEFEVKPCPNNSEVDCLHQDECRRCGWNPVVAEHRLKQFIAGCDGKISNQYSVRKQSASKRHAKNAILRR